MTGWAPTTTQGEQMKIALAAASLLLVAGGAAACGDDKGGGGSTASKDDFCAAFQGFYDDLQDVTGDEDNLGEILKKAAKKIEDAGTPKDIPADAKEGLKLTLDAIHDLPDDASAEDMAGVDADFSDAEQKKVDAFTDYLEKTCPDVGDSSEPDTDSGSGSSDGSEDSEPSEGSS
jgi:hypothetical protein